MAYAVSQQTGALVQPGTRASVCLPGHKKDNRSKIIMNSPANPAGPSPVTPPPRKRLRERRFLVIGGTVVAAGIAGAVIGTAASHPAVTKAPPVPKPSAPAPTAPLPTDTTPSLPDNSGPVGTTFTVNTQNDNGNDVSYDITLTQVDQHAQPGAYMSLDTPGDHLAAVRFTIKGGTGQYSTDANSDATAIGTDTTEYQFSADSVTNGGNFNGGDFAVSPGETVSGWVAFELPPGQKIASVQWSPSGGFGDDHATWTVGS